MLFVSLAIAGSPALIPDPLRTARTPALTRRAMKACRKGTPPADLVEARVTLAADRVSLSGHTVLEHQGDLADAPLETLEAPLRRVLADAEALQKRGCSLPIADERLIALDVDGVIPWSDVRRVTALISQAGFHGFMVPVSTTLAPTPTTNAISTLVGSVGTVPLLMVDGGGFRLVVAGKTAETLPCAAPCTAPSDLPLDALSDILAERGITLNLAPHPNTPWSTLRHVVGTLAPVLRTTLVGDVSPVTWTEPSWKGVPGRPGAVDWLTLRVLPRTDPASVVLGSLSRDVIVSTIAEDTAGVRACYTNALRKNPGLTGQVVVRFTIQPDGQVTNAAPKTDGVGGGVAECVTARLARLRFPEPKGGGIVIVSYPFVFTPR